MAVATVVATADLVATTIVAHGLFSYFFSAVTAVATTTAITTVVADAMTITETIQTMVVAATNI